MKGQAYIQYIFAMIVFFIIFLFIIFQTSENIPYYRTRSIKNRLYSDCFRISETMIKDNFTEYGFAVEPYLLNESKIKVFNSSCNANYESVKKNMGLEDVRDFNLKIDVGGVVYKCGPKPSSALIGSYIERYAYTTTGKIVNIKLRVW